MENDTLLTRTKLKTSNELITSMRQVLF